MAWDEIERRPARHPFAIATIETRSVPVIIIGWERGYDPMPRQWQARVIYWTGDKPIESLIPKGRIKPVGVDDPAAQMYVEHFLPTDRLSPPVRSDPGHDDPSPPADSPDDPPPTT